MFFSTESSNEQSQNKDFNMQKNSKQAESFFKNRHIGPDQKETDEILNYLNLKNLDELVSETVPKDILLKEKMSLPQPLTEKEALVEIKGIADQNQKFNSYIGLGYYNCVTPPVIQRNIFENPSWYTPYTPYQAEISQGRLELLLNFQTMVADLTGLPIANASLLDEATAAAEAMAMCYSLRKNKKAQSIFVSENCYPQTIEVIRTRANPLGIKVVVCDESSIDLNENYFAAIVQYPNVDGEIIDYQKFISQAHSNNIYVVMAADILSLTMIKSPGEMGADIAIGCSQRFGVPLSFGGPHAGYFSTKEEFKRRIPGRIVGVSKDVDGNSAVRLALQTREQHIRRDKATSNICTAQALLAVISAVYAIYHGPKGLYQIAKSIHLKAKGLHSALEQLGFKVSNKEFFDTFYIEVREEQLEAINKRLLSKKINLRIISKLKYGVSIDETTEDKELLDIIESFDPEYKSKLKIGDIFNYHFSKKSAIESRTTKYLQNPVFNKHHSETELVRYLKTLEKKDISLTHSMIPLGSCTMKLNSAAEMLPITWPQFTQIHPFVPSEQATGYRKIIFDLENWLAEVTGFDAVSLQPNAGSQGELSGLLMIKQYHISKNDKQRNICLIPKSAHGTNPATAVMAGMKVVALDCDKDGNISLEDLAAKSKHYEDQLAAVMITYPSTHGVFELEIKNICNIIHHHGGLVYLDGANLNAQLGLCAPGDYGADVCHLNLHKTFCIPHGGGGPGVGPIAVKSHLSPFLPGHPLVKTGGEHAIGPVSAAPFGSPGVLPISWMYIRMMGEQGLTEASKIAILNANYIAKRLEPYYPVLFKGDHGYVAHECIIDLRGFKATSGVDVEDVAKRLIDYGYHAPTISWPIAGTMMIEPTESENKEELDRFCDAMIQISKEIDTVDKNGLDKKDNILKNAPHTAKRLMQKDWNYSYTREEAAFPLPWVAENKFWPSVSRIDNVYGDRNLVCSCPSVEDFENN